MAEDMPNGQKVFDPDLGKERDAFVGEIVPPEQQTTLQRLMAEEEKKYADLADYVANQLDPEQQRTLRLAGKIAAEKKRGEYLAAIKTNPAVIIQGILEEFKPKLLKAIPVMLTELATNVGNLKQSLKDFAVTTRLMGGQLDKPLVDYLKRQVILVQIIVPGIPSRDLDQLLEKLGMYPDQDITTFTKLVNIIYRTVPLSNSTRAFNSDKIYSAKTSLQVSDGQVFEIGNLNSNTPGLEGISLTLGVTNPGFTNPNLYSLYIFARREAQARIVELGKTTS